MIFSIIYIFLALATFIYSYGFVDFNLTLSSHPLVMSFIAWVQALTYYNRDLSLQVFIGLIILLFFVYLLFLQSYHGKSFPWRFVIIIGTIFTLSYPLLSHDVFKYLFGAKTIFVYHQNPHLVSPQVFEGDTWLRFMRWVHTPSPYGPFFTVLTFPAYLLGLGKFVPALYLFKIFNLLWYLLAVWLVGKLGGVRSQLFFALNPLVLVEWLANSHNDAPMITLMLLSLWWLKSKNASYSLLALILSIGVKFITLILLPMIFLRKKLSDNITYWYLLIILALAPVLYNYANQYQAWYVTWLVPFAALLPNKSIKWIVGVYTFSVFSRYLSFVHTGLWETTLRDNTLMTFLPVASIAILLLWISYSKIRAWEKNKKQE